jgi:hypothetical protein
MIVQSSPERTTQYFTVLPLPIVNRGVSIAILGINVEFLDAPPPALAVRQLGGVTEVHDRQKRPFFQETNQRVLTRRLTTLTHI